MASVITVAQAIEDLFLQAVSTSTGTTDAFNSISGSPSSSSDGLTKAINAVGGAAGLTNVAQAIFRH